MAYIATGRLPPRHAPAEMRTLTQERRCQKPHGPQDSEEERARKITAPAQAIAEPVNGRSRKAAGLRRFLV